MAAQKDLRIIYQSKNNTTGLTDITAQVYVNDVAKAVGVSAISATANANGSKVQEVDATNAPGIYEVLLKAADLTAWGINQSGASYIEVLIDSAGHSAPAPFRQQVTVADIDDIDVKLGTPAGASVSADIASVKSDTSAIKVDLESGPNNLANIYSAIQAIQNNAGFAVPVPAQMSIPNSGSNVYRIPVTVYNENNQLVDPDTNTITVALVNQAGTSRAGFLSSTTMTRDSLGQYHVDVTIPSTEVEEELLFTFSYSIGGAATARRATTVTIIDVATSGYALQSTLLATQTTVNSIQSEVTDGTTGLAAIKMAINNLQSDVTSNVEGAGFSAGSDSLHQISTFLRANLFYGGRAV